MKKQNEKMMILKVIKTNASFLVEYSILLGVIAIAVIFMSNYVRRSVQGHIRENASAIGDRYDYSGKYMSQETLAVNRNMVTNVAYDTVDIGGKEFGRQITTTNVFRDDTQRTKDSAIMR